MSKELDQLINHYQKLLDQAVKDTGINLNLPRPFSLTPKDLISAQQEYRWAASSLLSRYSKQLNLPHGLHSRHLVQLNIKQKSLTIHSIVSQRDLFLPEQCYLLDYATNQWYRLTLSLTSRKYQEQIEEFKSGSVLIFPKTTLEYDLISLEALTEEETEIAKKYYNYHYVLERNPFYVELNTWVDGEFRRQYVVDSSQDPKEIWITQSELLLTNLKSSKAA